jgi:hypothetical protein
MTAFPRRQRGWAGLIVLLIVVAIIGMLASTALKELLGLAPGKDAKGPRGPGAATIMVDPGYDSASPPTPAAAVERANNLEGTMQKQLEQQTRKMDEIESK